ncbi:YigZ family protein [Sessilibacter sp. MAH1]
MTSYCIPSTEHSAEIEIKRSRFIAYVGRAEDRISAESFIKAVREQHPQARHVCWAYVAGAPNTTIRSMSDDGEPSGTAGRPMLAMLEHSGLGEVVVAVVRYFGGIKLGTGGLQRAYSDSVAAGLSDLPTKQVEPQDRLKLLCNFSEEALVRRVSDQFAAVIQEVSYTNRVQIDCLVNTRQRNEFEAQLISLSGGQVSVESFED